jgi:hypothetical protein
MQILGKPVTLLFFTYRMRKLGIEVYTLLTLTKRTMSTVTS